MESADYERATVAMWLVGQTSNEFIGRVLPTGQMRLAFESTRRLSRNSFSYVEMLIFVTDKWLERELKRTADFPTLVDWIHTMHQEWEQFGANWTFELHECALDWANTIKITPVFRYRNTDRIRVPVTWAQFESELTLLPVRLARFGQ